MTRVSARFGVEVAPQPKVDWRKPLLALFEHGAELYSVDVARTLGCRVTCAAGRLRQLELAGELVSTMRLSPTSGNGRRVYRRKVAV